MLGSGDEVCEKRNRWARRAPFAALSVAAAGNRNEAALSGLGRRISGLSRRGALADARYGRKPVNVHLDVSPVPRRDTEVSRKLNVAKDGPFSGSMLVRQSPTGDFP